MVIGVLPKNDHFYLSTQIQPVAYLNALVFAFYSVCQGTYFFNCTQSCAIKHLLRTGINSETFPLHCNKRHKLGGKNNTGTSFFYFIFSLSFWCLILSITYFCKIRFCKFSPDLSSPAFTNWYRYISAGQSFQCSASVLLYLMQLFLTELHALSTNLLFAACIVILNV